MDITTASQFLLRQMSFMVCKEQKNLKIHDFFRKFPRCWTLRGQRNKQVETLPLNCFTEFKKYILYLFHLYFCFFPRIYFLGIHAGVIDFKKSPDPSHFIFGINDGKRRIRYGTTLNLNDHLQQILSRNRNSLSESFYVGSDSFRQ